MVLRCHFNQVLHYTVMGSGGCGGVKMVMVFEQIHLHQGEQTAWASKNRKMLSFPPGNPLPEWIGQDFRKSEHKGQGKLVKGDR